MLVSVILISSCSSNKQFMSEDRFAANEFMKSDFAVYDLDNSLLVQFDMKKEEVEKQLENHIDTIDFLGVFEYDGIKIHYKDNKVNGIIIDDNTENNTRFQTPRGIKYGDSYADVVKKYGDKGIIDESKLSRSVTYIVESDGSSYNIRSDLGETKNKENVYTVSMNFYEEKMTYLMLADFEFSFNPTGK